MAFTFYSSWYDFRQKMSKTLAAYWRYIPNRWYLIISLVLQLVLWFFAIRIFRTIGSDLFVSHYNVDFGIDAVGEARRVFIAPLLAFGVLLFNFGFVLKAARYEYFHFLANATGLATLMSQILAALALMSLYLINFLA